MRLAEVGAELREVETRLSDPRERLAAQRDVVERCAGSDGPLWSSPYAARLPVIRTSLSGGPMMQSIVVAEPRRRKDAW